MEEAPQHCCSLVSILWEERGGKLIIIIMDNTNREQFIIAPFSPDYVSASCMARPDTIIRLWRGRLHTRGVKWREKGGGSGVLGEREGGGRIAG